MRGRGVVVVEARVGRIGEVYADLSTKGVSGLVWETGGMITSNVLFPL